MSHSEMDSSPLAGRQLAKQATANMSYSKTFFFSKLCVHKQCSQCWCSCVETLVITKSKVSCCVKSSYCFKNRDFDASVKVPVALPLKMSLTQKRKYSKS